MIAGDPYQDASRAYMKSSSMTRTREIERLVKNSRFGASEQTANDREEAGKTRNKEDRAQNTQEPQSSINKAHGRVPVKPIAKQMEHQTMRQQGERKQKVKF